MSASNHSWPVPRNSAELALLTTWYFGAPLSLRQLQVWNNGGRRGGFYEVEEDYSSYHGKGFAFDGYSCEGYDSSRRFWNKVFGELGTGGVARASYGDFKIDGHRQYQRLKHWDRISTPRPVFERLALKKGEGERAQIRGRRSVTHVREDAA